MTGPDTQSPLAWSYTTPRSGTRLGRPARRWILLAAAAVLAAAGLLTWLALPPTVTHPDHAGESYGRKPSLGDEPPTVILNALRFRSLYPPGYVDFDLSQQKLSPSDIHYVPGADYELSASPAECEHDPLSDNEHPPYTPDPKPEKYSRYPVLVIMYPVDDPGGNKGDNGFYLSVFPANDPKGLDNFQTYYKRCQGAQITVTATKDGQVVYRSTDTIDNVILPAPSSAAEDAFVRGPTKDSQTYQYIGLIRGMIVSVQCPAAQKDAGAELFRTVLLRVWDIQR